MTNIKVSGTIANKASFINPIRNQSINNSVPVGLSTKSNLPSFYGSNVVQVRTTLISNDEKKKYSELVNFIKDIPVSETSFNTPASKQMDMLLKSGKLLSKSNDSSTMLDNLYEIATVSRTDGLDSKNLISNILDNTLNPRIITQTLGDIPQNEMYSIVAKLPADSPLRKNPAQINAISSVSSGTCPAASNEVNLADKNPAEYARWVNKLSSNDKSVTLNLKLSSISSNKLDAMTILNLLEAKVNKFGFDSVELTVAPDDFAYTRAKLQDKYWNQGERNVADVLVQSAIMQAGSQNTYNSLTDMRAGKFNSNPKGLIEVEKTFVESLIKNKEITSLVYQIIDDDQNLIGHTCSFDKMEKHIKDTIDSGDNVIIGYVLTNETVGKVESGLYNPLTDGPKNRVINGHEITIVDYKTDNEGKTTFVCVDTDDDSPEYVEYSADWLLPKIHHAGYPAKIVEQDEAEILKRAAQAA